MSDVEVHLQLLVVRVIWNIVHYLSRTCFVEHILFSGVDCAPNQGGLVSLR